MPSEVGHSDFAAQDKFDMELIDFIKKKIKGGVCFRIGVHGVYESRLEKEEIK